MRLGLVQTTTTEDFKNNLETALLRVEQAAAAGVDLLAFPEVFLYLGGQEGKMANAQHLDGEVVQRFQEAAKQHHMAILLGSLHEAIPHLPDKVYNTSVLIDEHGEKLAHYRKIKLFGVDLPHLRRQESDTVEPGDAPPPVVRTSFGNVGLSICFDLRFPDLYQHLRRKGAQIIFAPSNFTAHTGAAHWDLLLRTRALENQVYLAAPAQYGQTSPKGRSYGHSALVDPWGTITALAPERPGLTIGEIDLDYLAQVRREMPMQVIEDPPV